MRKEIRALMEQREKHPASTHLTFDAVRNILGKSQRTVSRLLAPNHPEGDPRLQPCIFDAGDGNVCMSVAERDAILEQRERAARARTHRRAASAGHLVTAYNPVYSQLPI